MNAFRGELPSLLTNQLVVDPAGIVGFWPDGRAMTVAELDAKSRAIEQLLPPHARRVAVHAPASLDSFAALHACWRTGRTPVPVSTAHVRRDFEDRARIARAEALVSFDDGGEPTVEPFEPDDDPELLADEALVIFTSGTTGAPKGVVVGRGALEDRLTPESFGALPLDGRRATLVWHSMSHLAAPLNVIAQTHQGTPIVVPGRFTSELFIELIHRFDVGQVRLTPTMIYDLATLQDDVDLGHVAMVGCGTADLPEPTRRRFEDRYGIPIVHSYASTETIGVAIETEEDVRAGRRRQGSSGRIVPGVEVRLQDPFGQEVPPGEAGQLAVRSPTMFLGYIRENGLERLERGDWFLTNDLVRVDEDGFLYVLGRVDDVMVCGGFNIYPARVEAAIREVPGVSDAVVAARADDRLGQVPVAGVVLDPGVRLDAETIRERLRPLIAAYEVPRQIEIIGEIPRSPTSGKVDRRGLLPLMHVPPESVRTSTTGAT